MVFRGFYQHALQIHSISLSFGYRTPSKSFFTEMVFSRPLHPQLWQLFICNFTLLLIRKVLYNYIHFLLYYYLKTLINSKLSSFLNMHTLLNPPSYNTSTQHRSASFLCLWEVYMFFKGLQSFYKVRKLFYTAIADPRREAMLIKSRKLLCTLHTLLPSSILILYQIFGCQSP